MIYGIGTDIVLTERIATTYSRWSDQFISKLLSPAELQQFSSLLSQQKKVLFLTNRWVAKEAIVKALGTGLRSGLYLNQISVLNNELGKPVVVLSDSAHARVVDMLKIQQLSTKFTIHISLSHEINSAVGMALVEVSVTPGN